MRARISRRLFELYALDIESHNDEESIAKRETSMWLGCFINDESTIDNEESYFYNWNEFLEKCNALTSKKRKNSKQTRPCNNICIYVYNLSFEWSFLLPILLEKGFIFKEYIEKNDEYVFNSITTKSVSSVWQIQIKLGKRNGIIKYQN